MGGFVKTTCEDYEYLMPCVSSIYTAGPGIDISSDNVISNTGVLSVNGQTGHVIVQAGDVTFSPYPNTFNTTGTTAEFLSSIASLNLPTGSAYLGQVSLSDMPEGVAVQGDVEVYVYPQNVIYAIMRSAEVEPYQWVVDSYSNTHYGRGWIPVGNYVVESTTPSVAVEGMLWYDTTNNVVKVYDGTNWNEIGEGETYTAGTGIDITNNEISVDNTVAMTSDVNTKTFYPENLSDWQEAYDWFLGGKKALISTGGELYEIINYDQALSLRTHVENYYAIDGTTRLCHPRIWIYHNGTTVTGTGMNMGTYTSLPQKQYVDNGDTYVGSSAPSNPVEGKLWYDTTNDVLKTYDGTNWNEIGEGEVYTAGANITIDANNEISATDTTYSAGTYLTLNGTTFDVDTTLIATKTDLANFAGFEVVATLPQNPDTNIIYLKGPIGTGTDKYEEWIYSNSNWIQIGETSVDLTGYAQKSEVLVKTNTTSYTPTGNYNPATKKYVDDSISAITIPTVNDATLTVTQNGVSAGTFTANASANTTIALTDTTYVAGEGIDIGPWNDYSAMRGPAPEGFHIPLHTEWGDVCDIRIALGGGSSDVAGFGTALKLPLAGYRSSDTNINWTGSIGRYCASDEYGFNSYRLSLSSQLGQISPDSRGASIGAYSLRCFKDEPVIPTNSWTKLYGTSIEAGGIFWNSADGLISLSGDGSTWITIADKNLGATQVWNSGDTLSEANCGKYYQRGNNYGFPFTGTISNTSPNQVDTTGYGPGNYYSSDTYITANGNWFNPNNNNLRGGDTGVVQVDNVINNTGVLSVNGQTGHVTISTGEGNTKTFYLSSTTDYTNAKAAYDWCLAGKNPIVVYNDISFITEYFDPNDGTLDFRGVGGVQGDMTSRSVIDGSSMFFTTQDGGATIDYIGVSVKNIGVLATGKNYSTLYVPEYDGSPTTKKYVDDGDTYIGSSAPSNPVEGKLWYDTTNDVLKTYDGTNWNSTGGSFSQVQADWNQTTTTAVDYIKNKPNLSTVATSGSYSDLSNKPTIPAAQVQADWNQSTTTAVDYIKNKPTIPTVNNATLTIQKNGTTIDTFTANASSNKTINIAVPTKTSDISNDSGYITSSSIPSVGNGTITINQGGTQKGTFTTNQSGNTTINLDAGGGSLSGETGVINTWVYNGQTNSGQITLSQEPKAIELSWSARITGGAATGNIHMIKNSNSQWNYSSNSITYYYNNQYELNTPGTHYQTGTSTGTFTIDVMDWTNLGPCNINFNQSGTTITITLDNTNNTQTTINDFVLSGMFFY